MIILKDNGIHLDLQYRAPAPSGEGYPFLRKGFGKAMANFACHHRVQQVDGAQALLMSDASKR
jgi:hypothetical protein